MQNCVHLTQLLSAAPGHLYWLDRNNRYLDCNDTQARAFGLASRAEVVGKGNSELYSQHPEIVAICDSNNLSVMQGGVPMIVEEPSIVEGGILGIVLSHKVPLWNEKGEVIGLFGISLDLRHQKKIETTLKKEKKIMAFNFEKIIDAAPGELYWKDKEGVYLGCNPRVLKLGNLKSKAEIIGKKDRDLWPEYAEALEQNDQKVMRTGQSMTFEEKFQGGKINLSVKTPMRNKNGEIIGIIGNSLDITHLKKLEMNLRETQEIAEAAKILAKNKFSFLRPWDENNILPFSHENTE